MQVLYSRNSVTSCRGQLLLPEASSSTRQMSSTVTNLSQRQIAQQRRCRANSCLNLSLRPMKKSSTTNTCKFSNSTACGKRPSATWSLPSKKMLRSSNKHSMNSSHSWAPQATKKGSPCLYKRTNYHLSLSWSSSRIAKLNISSLEVSFSS